MKKSLTILVVFLLAISSWVQAQTETYSRVKIWTGEQGMKKLNSLGIETDHGQYRKGVWLISDYSNKEIEKIANAGFRYDIMIQDVKKYYVEQSAASLSRVQSVNSCSAAAPVYNTPANFSLGSYAGYFTYQEMLDNLDSMASKFPNLITIKQALPGGTTIENRPIYYVKISDNPAVDETEPEMLYTAVHHAREPGSMSQLIFYMWYLLENYNSNTEIQNIINNTELFFIPCVNPDGYLYNEFTDPNGGGFWRKNRRDNLDGTFGVDLNRNYGYNWGYDNDGSSPFGSDETYRGTTAFSEPETQLVRDFVASRNFLLALNYHTFGNLLIYPWGYDYSIYTPDSALFTDYGKLLTTYNSYTYGTADQTVGYITNGSSDDWMYGDQVLKPKVFSMTPECGDGAFGFWPPSNEIIPLCLNTIFQNITVAELTGRYAQLTETSPTLINAGGGYINYDLKQLGLDTTGTYVITLTPITSNIVSVGNSKSYSNLSVMEVVTDSISYALTTPMNNGDAIKFVLSIDNGWYIKTDTITKIFGSPTVAFASNGNSTTGWNMGQWGLSNTIFYSPTSSITDSPIGNYNSNAFTVLRITNPIDLTTAVSANLTFYARWETEPGYDWVQVQASSDNGGTWQSLCGKYTKAGSLNEVPDEPVYDGFHQSWVHEEMSLNDFLGSNILIRVYLSSDGFQEYDGFYIDDITVNKVLPGTNGINDPASSATGFSLLPNPANDYVYMNLASVNTTSTVIITDVLGKVIYKQSIPAGTNSQKINTTNFSKGVYFVELQNNGTISKPEKLIIQK